MSSRTPTDQVDQIWTRHTQLQRWHRQWLDHHQAQTHHNPRHPGNHPGCQTDYLDAIDRAAGDSTWQIDERYGALRDMLAQGIADAAAETGHLDQALLADWLAARQKATGALVGHHDLWARPV